VVAPGQHRHEVAEKARERWRAWVEADEDELVPDLRAETRQHARRAIEVLHPVELGRLEQPAVEPVRPAVVAALQDGPLPLPCSNGTSAVAADIRKRAQLAVIAANEQQRLVGDGRRKVLTRLPYLLGAAGELPRGTEDAA